MAVRPPLAVDGIAAADGGAGIPYRHAQLHRTECGSACEARIHAEPQGKMPTALGARRRAEEAPELCLALCGCLAPEGGSTPERRVNAAANAAYPHN